MEIPNTGNEGGDIWKEANWIWRVAENSTDTIYNKHYNEDIARANYLKGFGWNRLTFEPIRITKPTALRYGLTSDDDLSAPARYKRPVIRGLQLIIRVDLPQYALGIGFDLCE